MKTSMFCRAVSEVAKKEGGAKTSTRSSFVATRPQFVTTFKPRLALPETSEPKEMLQGGKTNLRPKQKFTDAELDLKRSLGLCFKCDVKWLKGHDKVCQKKELQVLSVLNGFEVEILDENMFELTEYEPVETGELGHLSLNAFLGIESLKKTKVLGVIGKSSVVVMLDSGASHNFISPTALAKAKLKMAENNTMEILLGNGLQVKGMGLCKGVKFSLAGFEFTTDFISLELGNVDVILGVQWLETLGTCQVDWRKQEFSFKYNGDWITLYGDTSFHSKRLSIRTLSPGPRVVSKGMVLEFGGSQLTDTMSAKTPSLITELLEEFEGVFAVPTELPPAWS
ncbi:uncharacterized protein LOC112083400 [Eutrema salsugineum]|uniref:uncharacterized protein LOC112083400 n=1 Tax=Eutrema salsugineum TaxID=72664 RepID=UPI000CECFF02|nr:uncharacterized protein LOC112083400 [Eutrema salsugineum]